jgi:hypothetical protein
MKHKVKQLHFISDKDRNRVAIAWGGHARSARASADAGSGFIQ